MGDLEGKATGSGDPLDMVGVGEGPTGREGGVGGPRDSGWGIWVDSGINQGRERMEWGGQWVMSPVKCWR